MHGNNYHIPSSRFQRLQLNELRDRVSWWHLVFVIQMRFSHAAIKFSNSIFSVEIAIANERHPDKQDGKTNRQTNVWIRSSHLVIKGPPGFKKVGTARWNASLACFVVSFSLSSSGTGKDGHFCRVEWDWIEFERELKSSIPSLKNWKLNWVQVNVGQVHPLLLHNKCTLKWEMKIYNIARRRVARLLYNNIFVRYCVVLWLHTRGPTILVFELSSFWFRMKCNGMVHLFHIRI